MNESKQSHRRPQADEFGGPFGNYIRLVDETDIVAAMSAQLEEALKLLRPVPEAVGNQRHAPYTWSVKQVVNHITDTERVFAYRALRFARGDATALPGFDENAYASAAESDRNSLATLVDELESVRRSNLLLFKHLPPDAWNRRGVASGQTLSVRALAYAIVGHTRHHLNILRRRLSVS
jgi:hypothetical protein